MVISLLDGNVLVALAVTDHVHHDVAESWFNQSKGGFATCPITQGSLLRLLMRNGESAQFALEALTRLTGDAKHEFWPDELPFAQVKMDGIIGHRQITDAYVAQLARYRRGRLVTFDKGLSVAQPDVVDLLDTH
ncbi:TA system VapC family ribonuclease toxin [Nocardia sp. NPDC051570]|uniref:TA system VapC family ribonuclease toxin n=1 Tax=Nocardia sp. NPDC051570 TaxID=3364324 RepID=UPI0037A5482F